MSKRIYFLSYCLIIFGLILKTNPYLLSEQALRANFDKGEYKKFPPIQWKSYNDNLNGTNAIFYRSDMARTGQIDNAKVFTSLQEVWRVDNINIGIHGASKATPVVDESGIYVGSDSSWFYAYNHDGSLKWKYYTADAKRGIHSTALLGDKYVYFGSYNGWFYCLDKTSGEKIWTRKIGDAFGSSPVLADNAILIAFETFKPDGFVIKMDPRNGETIWVSPKLGDQSHSSPTVDLESRQVFLGANNAKYFALDLDSGSINWQVNIAGAMKGTSLLLKDSLYFSDWGESFSSLNKYTGSLNWSLKIKGRTQTSPSVLLSLNQLVVPDHEGNLYFVSINGKIIRQQKVGDDWYLSSPLVLSGQQEQIILACKNQKICLVSNTGKITYVTEAVGRLTGAPAAFQNRVYVALDQGPLIAFEAK